LVNDGNNIHYFALHISTFIIVCQHPHYLDYTQ